MARGSTNTESGLHARTSWLSTNGSNRFTANALLRRPTADSILSACIKGKRGEGVRVRGGQVIPSDLNSHAMAGHPKPQTQDRNETTVAHSALCLPPPPWPNRLLVELQRCEGDEGGRTLRVEINGALKRRSCNRITPQAQLTHANPNADNGWAAWVEVHDMAICCQSFSELALDVLDGCLA